MTLNDRSQLALEGVHPDLVAIVHRARERQAFVVVEGRRTLERQREMIATGKSRIKPGRAARGRHVTGHAVDLVDAHFTWSPSAMAAIAAAMKDAAAELGVPIEWGGDWAEWKDTPHFQLPVAVYPEVDWQGEPETVTIGAGGRGGAAGVTPPPIVDAAPGGKAAVGAALKGSWTIGGALVAFLGNLVGHFDEAVGVLLDAAAEIARLGPLTTMLNLKAAGFGLTAFGVTLVIVRRVQAAYRGKVG